MTAQRTCTSAAPLAQAAPHTDLDLVDDALDRLPQFRGRERFVESLPGGLTNRVVKVSGPDIGPAVVRVAAGKSDLLAIDRYAECYNAAAAARAGAAPRVLLCDPAAGVSVVEWIDGRTLEAADLDDAHQLARVAETCRQLHRGPRFANDFDMFDIQRHYLFVVQSRGLRLPPRYLDFAEPAERIRTALTARPNRTVPCHNDLLAANIMDDGQRLWFIDYEYAGNNDPCFELGNIWSESTLTLGRLDELVDAYYGRHSAALIARARLLAVMSKYGWMLWAAIQDAVSETDFDFWSWGLEKYERAVAEFDGPEFSHLIDDVQQPV